MMPSARLRCLENEMMHDDFRPQFGLHLFPVVSTRSTSHAHAPLFRQSCRTQVEKGPMWQLLFWISFAEIILFPTVINMDKKDREPGDFALDPLNLCKVRKGLF